MVPNPRCCCVKNWRLCHHFGNFLLDSEQLKTDAGCHLPFTRYRSSILCGDLCLWGVRRLRIGPCSGRILISGFDLCSGLKPAHHPGSDIVLGCQTMTSFLEKMINYWLVVCIRHLLACPAPISVLIWSETCALWAFVEGRPRFPKGSDLRPQSVRARLGGGQFVLLSLVTSRVQGHRSVSHSSVDKGLLTSVPSFPPSLLQFRFISRSVSHLFFQAL